MSKRKFRVWKGDSKAGELKERDYQKESENIKDYVEDREELVGQGGQETDAGGGPFNKKRDKARSKSAPPIGK